MLQEVGKYRIVERIGRGGMGSVYKALDPVLDRLVALKVISADVEVTEELRARFFREAQACAKLSHPNIVTIHDLGDADGNLFIVMELLEGEELRQLIAKKAITHLEDKLSVMAQICDGLGFAHQKGIVHRDVKPGNIFVLHDRQVKILDFGIAHIEAAQTGLTRTGLIMGTLQYMAPERVRGQGDHRSDIFSVGAVFYELLTGRPPFVGEGPMEILEQLRAHDPPRLTELDPMVPAELDAVVERALRKDPAQRFATLAQMRSELLLIRRKMSDDAERLRTEVQGRLRQLRDLREALTVAVGGGWADETVLVVDERTPLVTLGAVHQDAAARIQRLSGLLTLAESLEPALERGLEALQAGEFDEAVRELEQVVTDMPDHERAAAALKEARREASEARQRREQLATLMQEARAAFSAGEYARCVETLDQLAQLAAPADVQAEAQKLRRDAELAHRREQDALHREAVRRAREAATAMLEQLEQARRSGEVADAPHHARSLWDEAGARLVDGQTAMTNEAYTQAELHFREATKLYERAAAAARELQAAAAAAARLADELTDEAARHLEAGRFAECLSQIDEITSFAPEHARAIALRSQAYEAQRRAQSVPVPVAHVDIADPEVSLNGDDAATQLMEVPVAPILAVAAPSEPAIIEVPVSEEPPPPVPTPSRPQPSGRWLSRSGARMRAALATAAVLIVVVVAWWLYSSASRPRVDELAPARSAVQSARERAVSGEAESLASAIFGEARSAEADGDRLAAAGNRAAAADSYRKAVDRYADAERTAALKQQERGDAQAAREQMAAAKSRARPDAADLPGALAQEREGEAMYERHAFKDALSRFKRAAELFAKAALPKPAPAPPDPRAEIRALLNEYVRALQTRDLTLLRRIRPTLTDDEARRFRSFFDMTRSHKIELRVYEITINGESAQALGRREDSAVLSSGQRIQTETRFAYTLKRASQGWVIQEVHETADRPATPRSPSAEPPRRSNR